MTSCSNDEVCWSRADPITLLYRTFSNKQGEADKKLKNAILSAITDTSTIQSLVEFSTKDYDELITIIIKQLHKEGYMNLHIQNDGPNNEYELHMPEKDTVRVIIIGTLLATINSQSRIYNSSDEKNNLSYIQNRFIYFPVATRCSFKIGREGCIYITGTK